METYVILFRGINVGGKNLVPMKELIALFEDAGYQNIKTYIQSGNVVLQCKQFSHSNIRKLVSNTFGFNPECIVLKKIEFLSSIKNNPFHPQEGKAVHFYFCSKTPKLDLDKAAKYLDKTEKYKLNKKVFYFYAPKGIGRSKLAANLESCLGASVTGRNLNTINKLEEMVRNA